MSATAYPLTWPQGWPRARGRRNAAFSEKGANGQRLLSLATAIERLEAEVSRLGAKDVILSTNRERRLSGQMVAAGAEPMDPGAAVFFTLKGKPTVLACDAWNRVADNIGAIAKHVEAIRGMDRWGVGTVEQVFTGYQALPAPESWWQVLGLPATASLDQVESAYRAAARKAHPDAGGPRADWDRLQAAYEAAKRERSA